MKTEIKNIPALRFPEFVDEWKEQEYGKIFTFRTTNSFSRDNLNYEKGNVKNIHYGDIHTKFDTLFDITQEHVPFINQEISLKKIAEDNYCKVGDLIIADASENYADIGKCIEIINLNDEKVLAGLHTFLARPNLPKIASGFNGYLMQSPKVRLQVMLIAQGTKVLGISTNRLTKIKLRIPSLEEQNKIATFLTKVDKRLHLLKSKKKLLKKYKEGVVQKIFNQEIRFKDDNGNNFADWKENKLGEVGKFSSGTGFTETAQGGKNGIPFYKVSDMNLEGNEFEMTTSNNYVDEEQIKTYKYKPNNKPSIIFAKVGAAIFLERKRIAKNFLIDNNMMSFTPNDDILFMKYLFETLRLSKFAQVGALPSYNSSDIGIIKIKLPSKPEQQKIAAFLSAIDEKIKQVNLQLEKTKEYKKGLLQQMFI